MKIQSFEVIVVDIPMRMSVEHTLAKRISARNVLVRALDHEGNDGWGECCPREYVTGETIASVCEELAGNFLPPLVGAGFASLDEAAAVLGSTVETVRRDQQAAFCAAELAILDLVGKTTGASAGDVLGPTVADQARYSGVLAATELEQVKKLLALTARFKVGAVKVKVVPELDTNRRLLELAREILGADVELRLDANAAWDAAEAIRQLGAMSEFGIAGVEQPVAGGDWDGMSEVTAAKIVPVVADESLCSMDDARRLVEERGCDVFNVRISKCGGLINSGRIDSLAREAGLKSQLGAQVGETGILSAAGRQFATRNQPIWCEGSFGTLLLEEDLTEPDVTFGPGGFAPALTGAGLGVTPIAERVEARRVEAFHVPRQSIPRTEPCP